MVNRKIGTVFTTISIMWKDKEMFRRYAQFVKKTKNGDMYENDCSLFKKMLDSYTEQNPLTADVQPKNTYPKKITSQERVQQS